MGEAVVREVRCGGRGGHIGQGSGCDGVAIRPPFPSLLAHPWSPSLADGQRFAA